jgi:uncharacterized protein YllA (UPF0747 family)
LLEAADGAARWSDAFARLLTRLLGDEGLLLLDPLDPEVARLWRPQLERELDDPEVSADHIRHGATRLEARGFAAQLGRAEGATNLFVERPRGAGASCCGVTATAGGSGTVGCGKRSCAHGWTTTPRR